MLRELVCTATDYISASSTEAGVFTTKASKTTKTGLWELDQSLSATNSRIKAHASQMTIKIEVITFPALLLDLFFKSIISIA